MEHKIIKHQSGYLLIVAIIAIVIIGVIGSILTNMYIIATRSTINSLQSDQAFYIAKAGLEIARRDLLQTGPTLTCNAITGTTKYTNACYPPGATACTGYFTVEGLAYTSSTPTLTSALTSTATTISLSSTTGLSASGVVIIDTEVIWYGNISGTQLQNIKRGAFGTTSTAHSSGTAVNQNECILTSIGMVPTSTNSTGKRKLREILWKAIGSGIGTLPNNMTPALIAAGGISLTGNSTVNNPSIDSLSASNLKGSTIISGGQVVINGNAKTTIGNGIKASYASSFAGDIDLNDSNINISTLWRYIFSQSKDSIKNNPSTTIVSNCNAYSFSGASSGTIWIADQNCNIPNNTTIGSANNPVILIFNNTINPNSLTINGLIYAMGSISINGNTTINGLAVSEGAVNINGTNNISFDTGILSKLGLLNTIYNNYYISSEVFD